MQPDEEEEEEKEEKKYSCSICIDEYSLVKMRTLPCNHRYCQACLAEHLGTKIREGRTGVTDLSCP